MNGDALKVLDALYDARTREGFVELRPIRRSGGALKPEFIPCTDLRRVAKRAVQLRDSADVYFGVALRTRLAGGKNAVEELPAVWADLDSEDALANFGSFPLAPTFTIASGTAGNLHAYWVLEQPVTPETGEQLNRALAAALGSDEHVIDSSRILRLPGTLNHKTEPPVEARLADFIDRRYTAEEMQDALSLEPLPSDSVDAEVESPVQRVLRRLEAVQSTANGWTALCPAHDDHRPSLSVAEGEDGRCLVHCFAGCEATAIAMGLGLTVTDLFSAPADEDRKPSRAARLVQLADDAGVELFHDDGDQALAWIPRDGHREVWRVESTRFRLWLRYELHSKFDEVAGAQALAEAVEVLVARALFAGPQRPVFVRVGAEEDSVFLDLGDDQWRVIEVAGGQWRIRDDSPVAFVRRPSTLPLAEPVGGGSLEALGPFLNLPDERAWRLVVAFLVMALQPQGPFPILVLQGEQGSAKSTSARVLRLLVDPVKAMLRAGSPDVRDLMIAASGQWLVGFDNVSKLSEHLSDVLCQLSTGAGFATRQLYTDAEEVVFEAMRPAVLNGISGIAQRPDFLDRAIVITLRGIPEEERTSEHDFWDAFELGRPRIQGALLDLLAKVLALLPEVELGRAPRLADFARVGTAVERDLGWPPGSFMEALKESQSGALEEALDAEPIAGPLQDFAHRHRDHIGTMSELLAKLNGAVDDDVRRKREWPKTAALLGAKIWRLAPALREQGVLIERVPLGRGQGKRRGVRVRLVDLALEQGDGGDDGDGDVGSEDSAA